LQCTNRPTQTEPVTAQELRQAKASLPREIPLGESSVAEVADGWLHRVDEGLPLDEPIRAAKRYVTIDAEGGPRRLREMAAPRRSRAGDPGPPPR
jgi:hypothetical protein